MIIEALIFILTSLISYCIYKHKSITRHFDTYGIKYIPGVPLFGNVFQSTLSKRHMIDDIDAVYNAFPEEKYVGYIEGNIPVILVRDPELIKSITVKNFDHFVNHRNFTSENEPLFWNSLLLMKDNRWREMRTTLSPAFTGSKMKQMMPFMTEITNNIIQYLKDHSDEAVDLNDIIRRYTNDVIASAAFGLQVDSLKQRDNEFYQMGQSINTFSFLQKTKLFLLSLSPAFCENFGIKIFPDKVNTFFRGIVTSTMVYREKNNIERPDMIQILMEASKGKLKADYDEKGDNLGFATAEEEFKPLENIREWSHDELSAQAFIFFFAGFESAASVLVMSVHALAINPAVQEKLYQEIRTVQDKGGLTYDRIQDLKYLDCVINETLRLWSPAIVMDRICQKSFELPPPREGGKSYTVKPGDMVYNAVNSLHLDPKYFPNPKMYNPERFTEENKSQIKPFTFMPFGMGPRNCIGSRFALLELKVLLYHLVMNFKILKCEKTADPIELFPNAFIIKAKGGSWVKIENRN